MTNALLILIILAVILLLVSLVIWKSSLPENDKITSLILILLVFSLVAILNESKRAQQTLKPIHTSFFNVTNSTVIDFHRQNAKNLEKLFYEPTISLEKLRKTNDFFGIDKEFSNDFQRFLVIFAEKAVGKTNELLGIVHKNVENRVPTLYFDCENREFSLENLLKTLNIDNLAVLEETIEKINKNQRTPLIIVDNFIEKHEFCEICGVFAYFFEKKLINIVFATREFTTLRKIENDRFLQGILQRKDVFFDKNQVLQIIRDFNEKLSNKSQIIDENQTIFCEEIGVFDYILLQKYQENSEKIVNFKEFCMGILKEKLENVDLLRFKPLFQGFLRISQEKHGKILNEFVSYSELRALKLENFAEILQEAVKNGYFENLNGKYRVRSEVLLNSLVYFLKI